jgi:Short C-terminal domain
MAFGRDRRQRRRRVAAVGGAAVAAKKHHDAKQAEQEEQGAAGSEQAGASQPAPAGDGGTPQKLDELKQLGELHEQGVLSDEEFEREKAKVLGSA